MKKTITTIIFIFTVLLQSCFTSCSEAVSDSAENEILIPEHQEISVLCNDTTKSYVDFLVSGFNSKYADVTITVNYIEGIQASDYSAQLSKMLEDGTGPDIIMLGNFSFTTNDVSLLKFDYFLDINALNQKYNYLDWANYEEKIINAGIFDGKRKIIPLFYEIPSLLIGIEEHLEKNNIAYQEGATFKEFVESTKNFDGLIFRKPLFISDLYRGLGLNMIDQYHSTASLASNEFKEFVSSYNNLFPDIQNGKFSTFNLRGNYEDAIIDPLIQEEILFINVRQNAAFSDIRYLDGIVSKIYDPLLSPIIITVPNMDGSSNIAGALGWCMGINSSTQSEEACLRFIKHAISFDSYATDTTIRGIPINRDYNNAVKSLYYGEEVIIPVTSSLTELGFNVTHTYIYLLDQYYDILSRVEIPPYTDSSALDHITNIVTDISKDGIDLDTSIRRREEELIKFLTE